MRIDPAPSSRTPTIPPDFIVPTFRSVYTATFPVVRRSARGLGIPSNAIDDVVQDVFLAVHRRLPHFAGRCSVENWVFGILLHVVNNHRRTRRRKGAGHAISSAVADPDELVGHDDPSDTVSLREARSILHKALPKLKQRHASVWMMAKIDGLSATEISQKTGLSVFTVYSRLKAATQVLDRELRRSVLPARQPPAIPVKIGSQACGAA